MKLIIGRQFNKSGHEFLDNDEIEISIRKVGENIIIESQKEVFFIPIEVFEGILKESEGK